MSPILEDWDLYTTMGDVEDVAQVFNRNLEIAVNTGMGADAAYSYMTTVMKDYDKYGAMDSEPHRVLDRLINYIYGDSEL